jgi:hypothetical protein
MAIFASRTLKMASALASRISAAAKMSTPPPTHQPEQLVAEPDAGRYRLRGVEHAVEQWCHGHEVEPEAEVVAAADERDSPDSGGGLERPEHERKFAGEVRAHGVARPRPKERDLCDTIDNAYIQRHQCG